RGMTDVVEIDGVGPVRAGDAFDGEVEHAGDGYRPPQPVRLDRDRLGLGAGEAANERTERSHGTAIPAAGDGGQCLTLLGRGAVMEDQSHRPVAVDHGSGRMGQHHEVEAVERRAAVAATRDVEDEPDIAVALSRPGGQARRGTRTDEVTAARLEVLAA